MDITNLATLFAPSLMHTFKEEGVKPGSSHLNVHLLSGGGGGGGGSGGPPGSISHHHTVGHTFNRGPKKFSLCLNSKSMREKREGGKGQNTVVRKDPLS